MQEHAGQAQWTTESSKGRTVQARRYPRSMEVACTGKNAGFSGYEEEVHAPQK